MERSKIRKSNVLVKTKLVSVSVNKKDKKNKKKARDTGKFDMARQILPSEDLNAEGTDVFVRDSETNFA